MEYKIVFKTEADLTAARQLLANTKEQTAAQKELQKAYLDHAQAANAAATASASAAGKSAKDSAGAIMGAKGAQAAKDTAGALAQMTSESKMLGAEQDRLEKKTTALSGSKRQWLTALKQLKNQVPGLGAVLTALKSPYSILIGAIAAVVVAIAKQIAKQNELAENAQKTADAFDPLYTAMDDSKSIAREASEKARDYAKELNGLADAAKAADGALDAANDQIDRAASVEAKKDAAEKAAEIAELEADPKFTDAERRAKRAGINAKYAWRAADRAERVLKQKHAAEEKRGDIAANAAFDAEEKLPAAEAEAAELEKDALLASRDAETLKEKHADDKADLKAERTVVRGRLDAGYSSFSPRTRAGDESKLAVIEQALKEMPGRLAEYEDRAAQKKQAAKIAAEKVTELRKISVSGREKSQAADPKLQQIVAEIESARDVARHEAATADRVSRAEADKARIDQLNELNNSALKGSAENMKEANGMLMMLLKETETLKETVRRAGRDSH